MDRLVEKATSATGALMPDVETVLACISDGFLSLDANWHVTYLNRRAEQILGYPADRVLGKQVWEILPGLIGSDFEMIYHRAMRERCHTCMTGFYPDHQSWYEVQVHPAKEGGLSIYFRDVTPYVKQDHRLRRSEQRLRKMADCIPQIVWMCDAKGQPQFANQHWTRFSGQLFDPDMALEQVAALLHPDDREATLLAWEEAKSHGRGLKVEHRVRDTTGAYRWFLVRAEPDIDPLTGEVRNWFGTSTDVHDHKLAQVALQKSEARYRSLFESIDEGLCIIDMLFDENGQPADYRFVDINPTFEEQTGLHDVIGKTALELVPGLESHWFEIYGSVANTGKPIRFENEAKEMHRWFDVYAFRIDQPADHRVAILFKDITERKNAEQRMLQDNQRKDEFLAMLAHELRNPLAPISAAAELLRLTQPDNARVRKSSEIISRQVRHMASLINDLLDVSRVNSGLVLLENTVLDIKDILLEAQEQVRPLIDSRRHHLSVRLAGTPMSVRGDAKRLVQVFSNLLNNAAKYTPEGGSILLQAERLGNEIVVQIIDNGIGMTSSFLGNAFNLFSQAERTADRTQGGLGIGLALVRSLVELHRGTVAAFSDGLNKGSRFVVHLPFVQQEWGSPTLVQAPAALMSKGLRVLLVDDNQDAARMLAMYLEAAGHEVIVEFGSSGVQERVRREQPQVCLLDIGLPDIDGYTLARRLKADPTTAQPVLIAITGYGQEQDRQNTAEAGFSHHLVKPVDAAHLMKLLAAIAAEEKRSDGRGLSEER
ncbi:PAS domain S-box protein [uncultured Oxalicibacterium sp.]|uniref:hybrid sensor histidine kinase/response regulator n=1 Tax=uncultured Oxalicibacterium sp. TaxID=1168540 RepID=UPI0025CBA8B5|nr:PAS domain S-box protein [uncultured Oxalicibacterium sp.]